MIDFQPAIPMIIFIVVIYSLGFWSGAISNPWKTKETSEEADAAKLPTVRIDENSYLVSKDLSALDGDHLHRLFAALVSTLSVRRMTEMPDESTRAIGQASDELRAFFLKHHDTIKGLTPTHLS